MQIPQITYTEHSFILLGILICLSLYFWMKLSFLTKKINRIEEVLFKSEDFKNEIVSKISNSNDLYVEQEEFTVGENRRFKVSYFILIKNWFRSKKDKNETKSVEEEVLSTSDDSFVDQEFIDNSGVKIITLNNLKTKKNKRK